MLFSESYFSLILNTKEPQNPIFYLAGLVKKLDPQKRNGIFALFIVNIIVILFFKFFLNSVGLLS